MSECKLPTKTEIVRSLNKVCDSIVVVPGLAARVACRNGMAFLIIEKYDVRVFTSDGVSYRPDPDTRAQALEKAKTLLESWLDELPYCSIQESKDKSRFIVRRRDSINAFWDKSEEFPFEEV